VGKMFLENRHNRYNPVDIKDGTAKHLSQKYNRTSKYHISKIKFHL